MTKQEIEEGNKLIAKFMKLPTSVRKDLYWHQLKKDWSGPIGLHYNKSYDWLIPVVIEAQRVLNEAVWRYGGWKGMLELKYRDISDKVPMLQIEPLYEAVVEFIKWFNDKEVDLTEDEQTPIQLSQGKVSATQLIEHTKKYAGKPFNPCPHCQGGGCQTCGGTGFVY